MAFFSSLEFIYPNKPPSITVSSLRTFCDSFRSSGLCQSSRLETVKLKFGESIDKDYETSSPIDTFGRCIDYPWDHEKRNADWESMWPDRSKDTETLYRAYICMGSLAKEISAELTAMLSPDASYEYIAPDQLSLQIGPTIPGVLDSEEEICFGFINLSLAGNGFFTWRPLPNYWNHIKEASSIKLIQSICRQFFPAPPFQLTPEDRGEIGDLFLNEVEYQQGDWVISVSESG